LFDESFVLNPFNEENEREKQYQIGMLWTNGLLDASETRLWGEW
jgi:hypothetical protein